MSDAQPPAAGSAPSGDQGPGADPVAPNFPSRRSLRDAERAKGKTNGKPAARKPSAVPPVPAAPERITPLPADALAPLRRRDASRNAAAGWARPTAEEAPAAGPAPSEAASAEPARRPAGLASAEPPAVEPAPAPTSAASVLQEMPAAKVSTASRAGRNLPAAIVVGLGLLVIVLGGLLLYPVAFVVIVSAFAVVGLWEVSRALLQRDIAVPLVPVMIGTIAMPAAAYFSGAEGLLFALVASAVAVLLWRSLDPAEGAIQSIFAGVFTLAWIPFMISFVFLLLRADGPTTGITWLSRPHVGTLQVVIILMLVVANDTFGYLIGAFFGKHPMAPKISPKKSWEGFAGSVGGAVLVAVPAAIFLLGQSWWMGLVLAVGLVAAATAGDLAESMVKRELGVKDMSSILPGHGGVMDRLDSILFAAPMAFLIFSVLARFQT